ncbi:MAG: CHASE2 domain-containing protein, partial [Pseudomonadota bacterium]
MAGATATRTADAGEASEKADAKPQRRWLEQLPVLAVVAALGVVALNAVTGAQSPDAVTRERIFDAYQRFDRPAPAPLDAFHVVEIDRESLDAVGPWPWPRTELARLVDAATADGARAVLIAEPIDAPDPLSADVIGRCWLRGGPDARLGDALATLPDTDAALADTLAGVRSAVAIAGPAHTATGALLRTADAAPRSGAWLKTEGSVTAPAAAPRAAPPVAITEVATVSVAALPADGDGIVRRVPVFWSVDGALTPALALEATRLAADRSPSALVAASANDNEGGRGRIETVVFESGGA